MEYLHVFDQRMLKKHVFFIIRMATCEAVTKSTELRFHQLSYCKFIVAMWALIFVFPDVEYIWPKSEMKCYAKAV